MNSEKEFTLIDPPVGPYSDPAEIRAWIKELEKMDPAPEVGEAISMAREWLDRAK